MPGHNKFYICGERSEDVRSDVNFADYMLRRFSNFKDKVAIIDAVTGARKTYGEISEMALKLAFSLTRIGVRKGHRVAVCAEERLDTIPTILGIAYIGAAYTFIDTEGPAIIAHRMKLVQPDFLISTRQAYEEHEDILKQSSVQTVILYGDKTLGAAYTFQELLECNGSVEPATLNSREDIVRVSYSSGTTGLSKGIPITHFQSVHMLLTHVDLSAYENKTVLIAPNFPPLWIAFLYAGATTVFMQGETDKHIIEAVQKYKVDAMQQMPTTVTSVVRSPLLPNADLSSLQRILCCSSPLTTQLIQEIHNKIPSVKAVLQLYGSTEAGGLTSDEIAKLGPKANSIGCVFPGVVLKVVDLKTRETLGPNEHGEICAKMPFPVPVYLGVSSTEHIDDEGFYKTGDIGYYDEDHYFYLADRIKDMIKLHGYSVPPQELEAVLLNHGDVVEAAVVAAPHDEYYEVPVAFVVLREGSDITQDDVTEFVNGQIPSWMRLAGGTIFVEELPRGKRGKIDRKALRKLAQAV